MKKTYINPEMQVVKLQYQHQILAGSGGYGAKGANPNSENIIFDSDGIGDDDV